MVTIDQLRAPSPDPWLNVFIDESGTNELDLLKQNVMRYFIVAAVFVDDDQAHSACTKLEQIALELCGGAEIMSKRIGSKHETRRRFLEAIQPIDFGYAAFLGSAADQRDSLRNVASEQAKSEMVRGNGVYLCPEGVCGAQEAAAAGVSSWISGGSVSSNLARMARCAAVISLRWRKLPAAPRKLPSCSF